MHPSKAQLTPQELTSSVLDISVTELIQYRTCRRRWMLETVANLEPKQPNWAFVFGSGMHEALDALLDPRKSQAHGARLRRANKALDKWHEATEDRLKHDGAMDAELDELYEMANLGHMMLENYSLYDQTSPVRLGDVVAIEGQFVGDFRAASIAPHNYDYPEEAAVVLHKPSGRLLVPIVDPDTRAPLPGRPVLSARIDKLTMRGAPYAGLAVVDHKTASSAPNDRGIDFDDQVTGYCYTIWRWLGAMPRSVIYDVLIKQAPKEPRILQKGKLSTAKDQLTTPAMYREALKEHGLITASGQVIDGDYADCMAALLARGWDPFFRRYQPTRNMQEVLDYEQRIFHQYIEMRDTRDNEDLQYPNRNTFICSGCGVAPICQAMCDGSDHEQIIESRYREGEDRKA